MNEAVTRIREKLDRADGVWSVVAGQATFNIAEMEADIRAVLEDYKTVGADRDEWKRKHAELKLIAQTGIADMSGLADGLIEQKSVELKLAKEQIAALVAENHDDEK